MPPALLLDNRKDSGHCPPTLLKAVSALYCQASATVQLLLLLLLLLLLDLCCWTSAAEPLLLDLCCWTSLLLLDLCCWISLLLLLNLAAAAELRCCCCTSPSLFCLAVLPRCYCTAGLAVELVKFLALFVARVSRGESEQLGKSPVLKTLEPGFEVANDLFFGRKKAVGKRD